MMICCKYVLKNKASRFVLSTLVFGPAAFEPYYQFKVDRRGHDASYWWLRGVGERMGIEDIPQSYDAFFEWKENYEKENMLYAEVNHKVATYSLQAFAHKAVPRFLHPLFFQIVYHVYYIPTLHYKVFPNGHKIAQSNRVSVDNLFNDDIMFMSILLLFFTLFKAFLILIRCSNCFFIYLCIFAGDLYIIYSHLGQEGIRHQRYVIVVVGVYSGHPNKPTKRERTHPNFLFMVPTYTSRDMLLRILDLTNFRLESWEICILCNELNEHC